MPPFSMSKTRNFWPPASSLVPLLLLSKCSTSALSAAMTDDGALQPASRPFADVDQEKPTGHTAEPQAKPVLMDVEPRISEPDEDSLPSKDSDEAMPDAISDEAITRLEVANAESVKRGCAPEPELHVASAKAPNVSQRYMQALVATSATPVPQPALFPVDIHAAASAQLRPPTAPTPPDAGKTTVVAMKPSSSNVPQGWTATTGHPVPASTPVSTPEDAERARRTAAIDAEAAAVSANWVHPLGSSQVNSTVLHRVRAILNLYPHVSQSGIARIAGISQGILSQYMHGRYRGNQENMEEKLGIFVSGFLAGKHDTSMRGKPGPSRARGSRGRGRGRGRPRSVSLGDDRERVMMEKIRQKQIQTRYEVHQRIANGDQSQPENVVRQAEFQRAQRIQMQLQHQQRVQQQLQQQLQQQGQLRGQSRVQRQQQRYMQQQQQQQQQRQQHYQHQQYLMQQQRVAQPQQPSIQPLAPSAAVERAYHAYHSAKWAGVTHGTEPLLLPLEIDVEVTPETSPATTPGGQQTVTGATDKTSLTDILLSADPAAAPSATRPDANGIGAGTPTIAPEKKLAHSLHYFTQWDVNERHLSPEEVAKSIVESCECVPALIPKVSAQIRRALFEAGVSCPVPPDERAKENRRMIKIRVVLGDGVEEVLEDLFEWDLCAGDYNSPELFSQHLCADTGFSQFHVPKVAQEIRRQVALAQAVSYGNAETRALALARLPADHPLREPLPTLESAIRTMSPEEIRAKEREENETLITETFTEPLLHDVVLEAEKRVADRAREAEEKELRELEEKKRKEALAEAERKRCEIKAALLELDANVHRVKNDHDIDLQPYLQLQLGRGARPSVWLEGLLIRKKRGLPIMPAVPPRGQALVAATTATDVVAAPVKRPRGRPRKNSQPGEPSKSATPRQGTKRRASSGSASRAQAAPETPRPKRGPPRRRDAPSTAPVERRRRSSTRGSQPPAKRTRK